MSPTEKFGPYLVYEQLGIGGMAAVHRAEQPGVHGHIALKRMLPQVAANDEMVKAFVREARLASHLRHPNVAQTYELGRVGEIYFIAMELVTGRNLREVLKHCAQTNSGPMPVPIALHILNQICDALDYAHNLTDGDGVPLGIIHRDVTPSNIIVSEAGVVKLIDFGIAKASAAGMQTMSGTLKGKFGYMAPEYIAGSLDARADLFALGVIAHELLTNRPLFTGTDDLETLTRVQKMEIHPPSRRNPNVPREIDDLVMTGLARDPDRRWQHATALRTALGTLTQRLGLVATTTQVIEWMNWIFDRTKPGQEINIGAEDPSIVISAQDIGTSELSSDARFAVVTPLTVGRPIPQPGAALPQGTPASITAQRSIQPSPTLVGGHQSGSHKIQSGSHPIPIPPQQGPEYHAAVARYERHAGISPGALMAEDVLPQLRQSNPQIAIPRTVTPPRAATPSNPPYSPLAPTARTIYDPTAMVAPVMPRTVTPSSVPPPIADATPAPTPVRPSAARIVAPAPKSTNWVLAVVMILAIAAAAAGVVYFVLPRLT